MSRINTNVVSLVAQRVLERNQKAQDLSLQRLSTGLKINAGRDDPAGLIASENLRAEKAGIQAAIDNASRAGNIVGTAEGGLNEVSALLTQLQGLVGQAASVGGLTKEEIAANQLQVDSILSTINRVSDSTSFQGIKLLNGNFDYLTSGVSATAVSALRVNAALIPDGSKPQVVVGVTQSARTGLITYSGTVPAGGATILIGGTKGSQQLSFASGTTVSGVRDAINSVTKATGLSARVSGTTLLVNSQDFGSKAFTSIQTVSGTFAPSTTKAFGRDAIVNINGAAATADGRNVTLRTATLDVEFTLGATANITNGATNFFITGGGATFALGSKVSEGGKASVGVSSVSTGNLGSTVAGGFLNSLGSGGANALSTGSLVTAQEILTNSIKQVSQLRGRLGAFQKFVVGSTVNNLGVALENANAADSAIRDTDFAAETAALTRAQILAQASTTVLSQANAAPQSVLSLLRG
jgi:flagellin